MLEKKRKLISVVCPVYNEENTIPIFYERFRKVASSLNHSYEFELIFTNNRSEDKSLQKVLDLRKQDASVQIITMSRNFGYQASVQAGITHASGEAIVIIDVDCEDPPEMIPQFLKKWEEGYDVVCGIRKDRPEAWIMKKLRDAFYHLLKLTADMDIVLHMAEFGLISSTVRDSIVNNQNTYPFLRAEIGYVGFSRYEIPYTRESRSYGKSGYNLLGMFIFATAGLLTSSTFLFRLAAYILPFIILANLILITVGVLTGSLVLFLTLLSFNLLYLIFGLTVHGIYIARIYKNEIKRPIYIIDPKLTLMKGVKNKESIISASEPKNNEKENELSGI